MGSLNQGEGSDQTIVLQSGSFECVNAKVDWAVAQVPIKGEEACGDGFVVQCVGDILLAAVVDGLGHGPDAAHAAELACEVLHGQPDHGLTDLVRECHQALRATRGAAMTLARLDTRTHKLSWLAVGNVEGMLLRQSQEGARRSDRVVMRGGVVGYQLPQLFPTATDIARGDLVVLASDGLPAGAVDGSVIDAAPIVAAQALLDRRTRADDALVLVVRYLGGSDERQAA